MIVKGLIPIYVLGVARQYACTYLFILCINNFLADIVA